MRHLTNFREGYIAEIHRSMKPQAWEEWRQSKRIGPPAPTSKYSTQDLDKQGFLGLYLVEDGDEGKDNYRVESNRGLVFILQASKLSSIG